jgi:hypothetical protein
MFWDPDGLDDEIANEPKGWSPWYTSWDGIVNKLWPGSGRGLEKASGEIQAQLTKVNDQLNNPVTGPVIGTTLGVADQTIQGVEALLLIGYHDLRGGLFTVGYEQTIDSYIISLLTKYQIAHSIISGGIFSDIGSQMGSDAYDAKTTWIKGDFVGAGRLGGPVAVDIIGLILLKPSGKMGAQLFKSGDDFVILAAAREPRSRPWLPNPGGETRTLEEAVELAKSWGVKIPDDINWGEFLSFEVEEMTRKNIFAEYGGFKIESEADWLNTIEWEDLLIKDMVPVRLNPTIYFSDEAIVHTIAHEMHEINSLRKMLEDFDLNYFEYMRQVHPRSKGGKPGNLHEIAHDVGDMHVMAIRLRSNLLNRRGK